MLGVSLEDVFASKNIRMSDQRRIIAQVLSDSEDHPNVEEIHRRALSIDTGISIATVYRTLSLFEEAGILERHDFGGTQSRYEEVTEDHHDHLIDVKTGAIIEFQNEEIEALQEEVAREHGLRLVGHRLELYARPIEGTGEATS